MMVAPTGVAEQIVNLLEVDSLSVRYDSDRGVVHAVDEVSFTLERREVFGLVGESGCGKTTLIKALLRLLPENARIVRGRINLLGQDLVTMDNRRLRKVRWRHISLIPQSAMNSLDPVYRVGDQIVEAIRTHERMSTAEARERVHQLFDLVGLERSRTAGYPHQFSGGMRQRAVIAMALALSPDVVVADEPTTSLDVIVQAQILDRLRTIQHQRAGAMIMVSHDVSVIAGTCNRIGVMYAGQLVEQGSTASVLTSPEHPYTMGLRNAFPSLDSDVDGDLVAIPGWPPDLMRPPRGCRFAPRCPFAVAVCEAKPAEVTLRHGGGKVACHRIAESAALRQQAASEETWRKRRRA